MPSFAKFGNDLYTGHRSYDIVGRRKTWFLIALGLIVISGLLVGIRGLNPGIEFRGGSEFVVSEASTTDQELAQEVLDGIAPEQVARVSIVGSSTVRVQTDQLTNEQTDEMQIALAEAYGVPTEQVTSSFVGPTWGRDVTTRALQGLVTFLAIVSVVMAVYFRTWTMAAGALIALVHDLIVTVGLYAGVGFEVTPATVIGFLTILGYSLYDTVVVFDKVRENTSGITEQTRVTYAEAANLAVNQTIVRSINTSVVAVLPVASILFVGALLLGAGTLRDIALALFIGTIVSTASSIFIATPVFVAFRERQPQIAAHTRKVLELRAKNGADAETPEQVVVGGLVAGEHQGVAAQPRRKRKR
ncbi:protein-export membrane protein SecF [Beutenbergia cavernae DSM 12333]|uniref:Protein-export membrane protein SecF n=1 Tax=Beutenbergia cavernae (strain ATCC BAA-8 / DSM 12333 / CCUG 43141 / JCM 11478 / NBRC 16432 / NCIMB 13614 / HKI 0122) TaxID=471853 RepID=C5C5R1_BEUC1|nr:protein-export membrane protein SecF [Beutenbergia cavernae DSM 12333]